MNYNEFISDVLLFFNESTKKVARDKVPEIVIEKFREWFTNYNKFLQDDYLKEHKKDSFNNKYTSCKIFGTEREEADKNMKEYQNSGKVKFTLDDKDFINNNSDEFRIKIDNKFFGMQILMKVLAAMFGLFLFSDDKYEVRRFTANHVYLNKKEFEKDISKATGYKISIDLDKGNKAIVVTVK